MKWAVAALLLCATLSQAFDMKGRDFEKHFDRVITISGVIDMIQQFKFDYQIMQQPNTKSDQMILIRSEGGDEMAGWYIIQKIEQIKKKRKVYCIVEEFAHSMAFNILTHCDYRYATESSTFMIHRIAGVATRKRLTAKVLRQEAILNEQLDKKYDGINARTMHIPAKTYAAAADKDTIWTAKRLRQLGYLHGLTKDKVKTE